MKKRQQTLTGVENGRSTIEMLAVLAIVALLSVGSLVGYSRAVRRQRLNETISQVALMMTNIRAFYGNTDNYSGFNAETAVRYNMVTEQMVGSGSELVNPYQGSVTISLDKAIQDGPNNTAFVVTYRGLPIEACVGLAIMDWGIGEKVGLIGVSIGSDNGEAHFPYKPSEYFVSNRQMRPITVEEAKTYCLSGNDQGAKGVVSWKYF